MMKLTRALALTCLLSPLFNGACSRNTHKQEPAQRSAPAATSRTPAELAPVRPPEAAPTQTVSESKPEPGEALYLGVFSVADVKRAAARSGDDARLRWRIRPWSGRADTLLALSFVALDPEHTVMNAAQLQPEMAVLEKHGAALQRTAAAAVPIDADSCICDDATGCIEIPTVDFDLARYRITESREAFGVRLTCHWTAAAAEGVSTWLTLFEPEEAQLRAALSHEVHSDTSDRVCGCNLSSDTTVQILSSQHGGHYDLRLQTRFKKTPFFDDVPLEDPAPPTSVQRLVWDGTHYISAPSR